MILVQFIFLKFTHEQGRVIMGRFCSHGTSYSLWVVITIKLKVNSLVKAVESEHRDSVDIPLLPGLEFRKC